MLFKILTAIGVIVVCGCLALYFHFRQLEKYWSNRGIPFVSSDELGGGLVRNLFTKALLTDTDTKFYNITKSRKQGYVGYLEFNKPAIFIRDLDLIKHVVVKDFDHFVDQKDFGVSKYDELTAKMLFFMEGEKWKELRSKMSPTFTTGKIRRMFEIVENSGARLVDYLHAEIKKSNTNTVDFVEGSGKFTLDVIASAAFGLESGAFSEKKSVFEAMAEKLQIKFTFGVILKFVIIFTIPRLARTLGLNFFDRVPCKFFSSAISNTLAHRKATGEKREDFLQLMMEARDGQLKMNAEEELSAFEKDALLSTPTSSRGNPKLILSEDIICAQSVLFLSAGFDTTQSLLQFAVYQLAVCPEVQDKLLEEIRASYKENGGKFTYDSINEMHYMDKFISETLRMFPPVPRMDRRCTKDYVIPGTKLVIPAGTTVTLPCYPIHHDEEIYPEPSRFDPERFSKEAKAARNPYAYMPFGNGPRGCIGMRFALTETKVAIAHIVKNFVLEPSERTAIPIQLEFSGSVKPKDGIWLNLKVRAD